MRNLRRLRWRSRKAARLERRFFETVLVGLLEEIATEGEPASRPGEMAAGRGSSVHGTRKKLRIV